MNFDRDQIEKMKQWCREFDGQEIDDHEANEAWQRLCDFFELLMEIDRRTSGQEQTPNKTPEPNRLIPI